MRSWQIALAGVFTLMIGSAPALAQTSGPPGSLPGPPGPNVPGPSSPNLGPATPGDLRPTTPGMPSAPLPRAPGSAPSASPPTMSPAPTTVPMSRGDCVGGGWTRFPGQGFSNENECVGWLNRGGK